MKQSPTTPPPQPMYSEGSEKPLTWRTILTIAAGMILIGSVLVLIKWYTYQPKIELLNQIQYEQAAARYYLHSDPQRADSFHQEATKHIWHLDSMNYSK